MTRSQFNEKTPLEMKLLWLFLALSFFVFSWFYVLVDFPEVWGHLIKMVSLIFGAFTVLVLVSSAVLHRCEWSP